MGQQGGGMACLVRSREWWKIWCGCVQPLCVCVCRHPDKFLRKFESQVVVAERPLVARQVAHVSHLLTLLARRGVEGGNLLPNWGEMIVKRATIMSFPGKLLVCTRIFRKFSNLLCVAHLSSGCKVLSPLWESVVKTNLKLFVASYTVYCYMSTPYVMGNMSALLHWYRL